MRLFRIDTSSRRQASRENMLKLIVDGETDLVLGVHIYGDDQLLAIAIKMGSK
jgi:pyruvate/2-oxoglutarate dehydrogenase complex dihydrolipoamide dehydrogenase (E3) component